jgi:hypothetical protein
MGSMPQTLQEVVCTSCSAHSTQHAHIHADIPVHIQHALPCHQRAHIEHAGCNKVVTCCKKTFKARKARKAMCIEQDSTERHMVRSAVHSRAAKPSHYTQHSRRAEGAPTGLAALEFRGVGSLQEVLQHLEIREPLSRPQPQHPQLDPDPAGVRGTPRQRRSALRPESRSQGPSATLRVEQLALRCPDSVGAWSDPHTADRGRLRHNTGCPHRPLTGSATAFPHLVLLATVQPWRTSPPPT